MARAALRIGIVCYPTVGGSGVIATEMAMWLARHGHEVHLISYGRPARLKMGIQGLRFHSVDVSAYPLFRFPPYDLALATRMLEVKEQEKLDLFHVHYAIPHAVSAFLARSMAGGDLRFVTTLHGTDITVVGSDRAYMRPTRFAIEESDAVTAVSRFLADETRLVFGVRRPIHVVPNFVDTARFRPSARGAWYQRGSSERRIAHVSNFRPVKRVGDVVRVFALVARELPARLLLVGDGPDLPHALAIAEDLGVRDRVEHHGGVEEVETLLAEADLCLSTSETESFGLSLLEAMACGTPCASTRVGGVAEVLGEGGILAPLGQNEQLAQQILALLSDDARHREAGAQARARAEREFAIDHVLPRYVELYDEVLRGTS